MLKFSSLTAGYGLVQVLNGVTLEVPERSVVTLLGANGAGKTTTLNTVAGLMKPWSGEISWKGQRCDGLPANRLLRMGVALVAEQRELFLDMTVQENLMLGAYTLSDRAVARRNLDMAYDMFPRLQERRDQNARTLSGGEQQMLAIARSLMSNPELLLLDEPSLGIAPLLVQEIFRQVKRISETGVTVLVVEQNAAIALDAADYGYVMESGVVTIHGPADVLRQDKRIQEAYLGS